MSRRILIRKMPLKHADALPYRKNEKAQWAGKGGAVSTVCWL